MTQVSVHEAKTHLSRLLREVERGEEVVIARDGEPVAKLVPLARRRVPQLGMDEGKGFKVPEDFNKLDDDLLDLFEKDLDL
ncbi:MAG: type II toxin-antitoxin system prevent-host-death family antitoxin [Dehalococcoidia bacterium]